MFANVAKNNSNFTRTENNAVALGTTGSDLLNLFAMAGAMRQSDYIRIRNMFLKAINEDRLLATKLMFYTRNIRGGLGERDTFRHMLRAIAHFRPDIVEKNINLIPHFGRFDDWYALVDTPCEGAMWNAMYSQLVKDLENEMAGKPISLLAKWMKSVNASSEETNKLGKLTAQTFGMSERKYRKMLSRMRSYLDVVEKKMSENEWDEIDYEAVPSQAMKTYRNAFKEHGAEFEQYIEDVKSGEKKINAGTLYPYDILMRAGLTIAGNWNNNFLSINHDDVLELQWRALPNYVEGENNVLVMADTSGSMEYNSNGRPLATAVGLALYFAERNKGAYKDLFMTFSHNPRFVNISGNTLKERLSKIVAEVANTDLEKAFKLILEVAIKENVPQEEMPKSLIIISDMQFDQAQSYGTMTDTHFDKMRKLFSDNGYEMPMVIFWNVEDRRDTFQVGKNDQNVILVSGQSVSTFKNVLGSIGLSPYEHMLRTLNDSQYDVITV